MNQPTEAYQDILHKHIAFKNPVHGASWVAQWSREMFDTYKHREKLQTCVTYLRSSIEFAPRLPRPASHLPKKRYRTCPMLAKLAKIDELERAIAKHTGNILAMQEEFAHTLESLTDMQRDMMWKRYMENKQFNQIQAECYISETYCFELHDRAIRRIQDIRIAAGRLYKFL